MFFKFLKYLIFHRNESDIIFGAGGYCINPNKIYKKEEIKRLVSKLEFLCSTNEMDLPSKKG